MSSDELKDSVNYNNSEFDIAIDGSVKLEDFNVPDVENGTSFDEKISSEIPVDVDTMGVVIDKAPSLSTDDISEQNNESILEEDISDLMADLMSSMEGESVTGVNADTENAKSGDIVMDEETIEAGRALEEYLNSPVEQLINHPEMPASLGLEVPNLDQLDEMIAADNSDDFMEFPAMPQMPDIPEVVEREHEETPIQEDNNNTVDFGGFNLEPITADNFDERFDETGDDGVIEKLEFSSFSSDDIDDIRKELAETENEEDDLPGEADIESLLAKAQRDAEKEDKDTDFSDLSLKELLDSSNDSKAEDIGELLDKAERNEAVDEGVSALLNGDNFDADINVLNDETDIDPKEAKKAEKLRLKEEKKEAKRKAKEEKAAAKAAKAAEKAAKKGKSATADSSEEVSGNAPIVPTVEQITESGLEHATDMSDVEALLAGAEESVSKENKSTSSDGNSVDGISETDAMADVSDLSESEALAGIISGDLNEDESLTGIISDDLNESEALAGIVGNNDSESNDGNEASLDDIAKDKGSANASGDGSEDIPEKDNKEKKDNPVKAFFGKIFNFLTESDDEDDEKKEIILSDENSAILDELNQEEGKGKKKKKKKDKKGGSKDGDENLEELSEKKPAKKKKVKKEKKPKKVDENEKPEPKVSKKKIAMVALVCIMLAAAIFIITYFTADYTVKKSGRDAYDNEDYQTCYQNLYGKKLTETETIMYNQSECILKIKLWLREYEVLAEEGQEARALDSLIQSVSTYPKLEESAKEWGCIDKVEPVYNAICEVLNNKYNLTPGDAIEISEVEDDVVYTRLVNAISNGVAYKDALNYILTDDISGTSVPDEEAIIPPANPPANMEDMLPEEDNVSSGGFIEP